VPIRYGELAVMDGTPKGASDTPPEVDALMFELWRRATPSQKLRKVFGLGQMINALARSDIRRRYPVPRSARSSCGWHRGPSIARR